MRKILGAVVLLWCVLLAAGCGKGGSDGSSGPAAGDEAGAGGGASLGPDLAEKPDGWPDDITLPEDTRITASLIEEASEGRTRRTINAETSLSAEDAHGHYVVLLADWTDEGSTPLGSTIPGLWSSDGRTVSTTADDSGKLTKLTVTVTEP